MQAPPRIEFAASFGVDLDCGLGFGTAFGFSRELDAWHMCGTAPNANQTVRDWATVCTGIAPVAQLRRARLA